MRGAGGTDMMPVAVLGCGNVGSRHLQGLLKLDLPMEIHVYDPSPASLARAEARASEAPYTRKEIRWYSRADSLPRRFHAAIIASISSGRVPLVELAARSGCRYLLMEKLVCQSMGEYREIERLCDEAGITAWVNFNCRYFRGYERVTGELPAAGTICRLAAFGGNHGLACNGIHFLDTFSFLSEADDLRILDARLDPELHASSRGHGLVDFSGVLEGTVGAAEFSLSFVKSHAASVVVVIEAADCRYIVDEVQSLGVKASRERQWRWERFPFESNYVSETTTRVMADVLGTGSCRLPTLAASRRYHEELFRVFNRHLESVTGRQVELCPVT